MSLYDEIQGKISGRLAMEREEAELLEAVLKLDSGNHIEIGTLWGGSAILAALCRPAGVVYAIDPMQGYYGGGDVSYGGLAPDIATVLANFERFGVQDRVRLVVDQSSPWPLGELMADSVLIDGDHSRECAEADWRNASQAARRFVIFHDIDDPAVREAADQAGEEWKVFAESERMRILERERF